MPVEYHLEQPGHTIMYVPILQMIQELLNDTGLIEEITAANTELVSVCQCVSCSSGSYFLEDELLSKGDLPLPLQLYTDELVIANPLCAVYWDLQRCHQNTDQL